MDDTPSDPTEWVALIRPPRASWVGLGVGGATPASSLLALEALAARAPQRLSTSLGDEVFGLLRQEGQPLDPLCLRGSMQVLPEPGAHC